MNTVSLLTLFGTVFLLNVISAFVPPTWMVMLQVGFSWSEADPVILADVAVCAVTIGRLVLARFFYSLVYNRWTHETDHQNIDVVRAWLEDRKSMAVDLMLACAFSPFPSNYIFTAYGLTRVRLWLISLPFLIDRWVNYLTWTHIAQTDARYLDKETEIDGTYMGVYFVVSQVVSLALAYGFAKLDWQHLLQTKHLRWRRRESIVSPTKDTRAKVGR